MRASLFTIDTISERGDLSPIFVLTQNESQWRNVTPADKELKKKEVNVQVQIKLMVILEKLTREKLCVYLIGTYNT